ncbi:MAG: acyltransferase [Candidatus Heimdallarchaeota archaeon]
MRIFIAQWVLIGILLALLVALWEQVIDPLKITLAWKLWLLVFLGWLVTNILLLMVYWLCLSLMTKKEGKLTGYNLALWGIAATCYDIALSITSKLFLHRVTPLPLLKLYGLRTGKNCTLNVHTLIVDPNLIRFGDNCTVGGETIVCAHAIEGKHVYRRKITTGNNVEIGGKTVVGPGAHIGDNTVVGAQSFVPKDMRLKGDTIYVGVPVRELRSKAEAKE